MVLKEPVPFVEQIPWSIDLKVGLPITVLEKAGVPSGSMED
ncbi:MAG: hypothetical protein AAB466_09930 [Verrucomicrobiota bacterium]